MRIARSICVTGHVQGVFFREWSVKVAGGLGIDGWVRNRSDGNVELYAVGEPAQIERFVAELHKGSPASRVDNVDVAPAEVENVEGFMRRSSK
jgi:acylphosphatase